MESATAIALPSSLRPLAGRSLSSAGVQLGLRFNFSVDVGLEERLGLGLDRQIVRVIAAVEERVNQHVSELRLKLQRKESELQLERVQGERLKSEKQEVEDRANYLSRQVSVVFFLFIYFLSMLFIAVSLFLYLSDLCCHKNV